MNRLHPLRGLGRAAVAAAACIVLASAAPGTWAQPRLPVTEVRTLMLAAFDAPDGAAAGVLTGPTAASISQRFGTTSPILVDVQTLQPLPQPGCRRLQVRFSQQDVQLPGSPAPRPQVMEFGVDFCRDGQPPRRVAPAGPAARSAQ